MSNEKDMTNKPPRASREYEVICYLDNEQHRNDVDTLLKDRRCVGILHDKDVTDDGSPKKPHFHILIKFDNASTLGSVLKLIPNHESNLITAVKSFKGACRYLLHMDNPEKAQYSRDDLLGNVTIAKKHINSVDVEADDLMRILEYVMNSDKYVRDVDVLRWCCGNGLYATYRRNAYTLARVIDQFNKDQDYIKNRERYIDELVDVE